MSHTHAHFDPWCADCTGMAVEPDPARKSRSRSLTVLIVCGLLIAVVALAAWRLS